MIIIIITVKKFAVSGHLWCEMMMMKKKKKKKKKMMMMMMVVAVVMMVARVASVEDVLWRLETITVCKVQTLHPSP